MTEKIRKTNLEHVLEYKKDKVKITKDKVKKVRRSQPTVKTFKPYDT